jgi:DNA polymerase-3 subunit epsilon
MKMLLDAPTFEEIYPRFAEIVRGKTVFIYNAKFDMRLYFQTAEQDEFEASTDFRYLCVMLLNSVFVGEWSDNHGNYKYQPLKGGDHTAICDCKATLELIKKISMAEKTSTAEQIRSDAEPSPPKKKWWQF